MKVLILLLFFIVFAKKLFFWVWLWQLKEYHLGRFRDHFRTEKGKKLILNSLLISKLIILLGLSLFFSIFLPFLFLIFFLETIFTFKHFFQKTLKFPVLTQKTFVILATGIMGKIVLLFYLFKIPEPQVYFYLLSLDIAAPLIFSFLVLSFQPLTIFLRNRIIKKAKRKRATFKNLLVIGITGSYGKTSTKEFLAEILSKKVTLKGGTLDASKVLKTREHQNSEMGISQCILNDLRSDHQIFIVEMGAYNRGGIKLLCDIVKPKIGIITGINEQHLATFGSMKNLLSAEGGKELIESLPKDGLVIFNGNNNYCFELYQKTQKPKKLCGKISANVEFLTKTNFDLWAEDIKVDKESLFFRVISKSKDSANFKVNLLGAQNIENILLAVCCAKELGMDLKEISKACQKLKPLPHQMELKKGVQGLNIIDATYSTNPDGIISHLEYLKIWPGKKVIVMPCLIELGKASKEVHKRIGKKIAEVCDLAIITSKERFKEIREGAIEKGLRKENIIFLENSKEILKRIKNFCQKDGVVLLEGRVPKCLIDLLINF